jgi:4'-phosphopantetheinyl transferase
VWWVSPCAIYNAEWHRGVVSCLSAEELSGVDKFQRETDRRDRFVTRVLVRMVLSQYRDVSPEEWVLPREGGRPFIKEPVCAHGLAFSVSHTADMIVCAVGFNLALGIDVERLRGTTSMMESAELTFAPNELASLRTLPPADQPERFLQHWTLKEAYAKARGLGLALPPERAGFLVQTRAGRHAEAHLVQRLAGDDRHWSFSSTYLSDCHIASIAVERRAAEPASIAIIDAGPLLRSAPAPGPDATSARCERDQGAE